MTDQHEHDFTPWVTFHHAPTGPPPEHTSFIVLLCAECGEAQPFPVVNYELTTAEFRAELAEAAKRAGWTFVPRETFGEPSQK